MDRNAILTSDVNPQKALLTAAIQSCTQERLRKSFRYICDNCPDAFNLACERLLTAYDDNAEVDDEDESNPSLSSSGEDDEEEEDEQHEEEPTPAPQGQKRKRAFTHQRYEVCCQCDKEYDILKNTKGI